MDGSVFYYAVIVFIVGKLLFQLWLEQLSRREVLRNAGGVPSAFQGIIQQPEYENGVQYSLAKGRFRHFEQGYDTIVLLVAVFTGALPSIHASVTQRLRTSAPAQAAFLFICGVLLSIPSLPVNW